MWTLRRYRQPKPRRRGERHKHGLLYTFVQHEKLQLLRQAARSNPFGTTHFFWVDMGMWRVPHRFRAWPAAERLDALPAGRALLASARRGGRA